MLDDVDGTAVGRTIGTAGTFGMAGTAPGTGGETVCDAATLGDEPIGPLAAEVEVDGGGGTSTNGPCVTREGRLAFSESEE